MKPVLPKIAYNQVLKRLIKIKANWDEDRIDHPDILPYDIDIELRSNIQEVMQENHIRYTTEHVDAVIHYLIDSGKLAGNCYGGITFPL